MSFLNFIIEQNIFSVRSVLKTGQHREVEPPDIFHPYTSKITVKPEDGKRRQTISAFLKQYGLKQIGKGYYGAVFSVPNKPYVLKFFSATDTQYLAWIRFSQRNSDFVLTPKFFGQPIRVSEDLLAIRMETLRAPQTQADRDKCRSILSDVVSAHYDFEYNRQYHPPVPSSIENTDLAGEIKKISALIFHSGFVFDLDDPHDEDDPDVSRNMMMRGNQPVITDPVAGPYNHFNRHIVDRFVKTNVTNPHLNVKKYYGQ